VDACILGCGQCDPESSCAIHEDWQKVRKDLVSLLQTKSIAEVASVSTHAQAGVSQTRIGADL
jgi:DNA-binding IscR family transcriptional regulator